MSEVKIELPEIGEVVRCTVEFWRHGTLSYTEEINAAYLGMNDIIDKPMFDIETGDEAAAFVTRQERLPKQHTDDVEPA